MTISVERAKGAVHISPCGSAAWYTWAAPGPMVLRAMVPYNRGPLGGRQNCSHLGAPGDGHIVQHVLDWEQATTALLCDAGRLHRPAHVAALVTGCTQAPKKSCTTNQLQVQRLSIHLDCLEIWSAVQTCSDHDWDTKVLQRSQHGPTRANKSLMFGQQPHANTGVCVTVVTFTATVSSAGQTV